MMESPVRVRLGVVFIVTLVLISGSFVSSSVIPIETTTKVVKENKLIQNGIYNSTSWLVSNNKSKADDALNELNPKSKESEEQIEIKSKSINRGNVKFRSQPKSSTQSSLRRARGSTDASKLMVVTPKSEVKKSSQISDRVRSYKENKLYPTLTSTIASNPTIKDINVDKVLDKEEEDEDEEEEDEDDTDQDEEKSESFEKYTKSDFHLNDFFTIPSYNFSFDTYKDGSENKLKQDYSGPSYDSFSSFFPKFNYDSEDKEEYKTDNFFDFGSELTTPKNDYFDNKFKRISASIIKNLETRAKTSPMPNATNVTIFKEKLSNGVPNNGSTVIIQNTKEIRLLDNDKAGTDNKELSDLHGTSIYYEMSVVSTETYNLNQNEDDCDVDTLPVQPTSSTSSEEELASVKATQSTILPITSNPFKSRDIKPEVPTLSTTSLPFTSSVSSIFPFSGVTESSQNSVLVNPPKPTKVSSNFTIRSRNYSKRLNLSGRYENPNSVSTNTDQTVTSRKFHFTTPKNRKVWMAPTHVTKTYSSRPTHPTTIYSEYFNIKDKIRPAVKPNNKTVLTTVSSDIDPVLETEISGVKKLVHSQAISDNTIPSLSKRGSTKFTSSTATSVETETEIRINEMEIPPTLTAWALASMISPPSSARIEANLTSSTQKSVDENELQRVGEVLDKRTTMATTTPTMPTTTPNYLIHNNITEVVQNTLPIRTSYPPHSANYISPSTINEDRLNYTTENLKNITTYTQDNAQESKAVKLSTEDWIRYNKSKPLWLKTSDINSETTTESAQVDTQSKEIPPVDAEKSTGFESITKLPSEITTPRDDTIASAEEQNVSKKPSERIDFTADEHEITTSKLSHETTNDISDEIMSIDTTTDSWHPIVPTRTRLPSVENIPITTYRPSLLDVSITTYLPTNDKTVNITSTSTTKDTVATTYRAKYLTTTDTPDIEETTIINETTPLIEVSSHIANMTEILITPSKNMNNTTIVTISSEYTPETTESMPTTTELPQETAKVVVEVITEINTENGQNTYTTQNTIINATKESIETLNITYEPNESTSEENSGSNEVITQDVTKLPRFSTTTTTSTSTSSVPLRALSSESTLSPATSPKSSSLSSILTTSSSFKSPSPTLSSSILSSSSTTSMSPTITIASVRPVITSTTSELPSVIITVETTIRSTTEPKVHTSKKLSEEVSDETTIYGNEDLTETTSYIEEDDAGETTTYNNADVEDLTTFVGDMTTESSSRVGIESEETGSGAAVAIAVSTIGVTALILLVGLLLVVRRRGRRGVYAQRCTPVSLDAYSLDSVSVGHRKGNQRLRASKRSYGNPAYDDEVTSHPMQYAALANFALDIDSMIAEFSEIPSVTVRPDEVPPGCEDKNRYSNVLPLPETRVPLSRIGNDPTSEYINANYITGPGNIRNYYIACQAPLSNTVVDFWRMIWEQNSRLIVMLTEYMENGVEKCYEYIPPSEISDNRRTFGEYQIILKKREQKDKYAISTIQVINMTTRTWREITHLWYFWPAKGVPEDYDSVIDFLSEMRSYMKISQIAKEYDDEGVEVIYGDQTRSSFNNLAKLKNEDSGSGNGVNVYSPAKAEEMMKRGNATNGTLSRMKAASEVEAVRPCTVVCASGAGRSAALIALDVCARALAAVGGGVDVPRVVRELRAQRPHSLSNKHHYIFLYKVLSEYGNNLMGGGVDTI